MISKCLALADRIVHRNFVAIDILDAVMIDLEEKLDCTNRSVKIKDQVFKIPIVRYCKARTGLVRRSRSCLPQNMNVRIEWGFSSPVSHVPLKLKESSVYSHSIHDQTGPKSTPIGSKKFAVHVYSITHASQAHTFSGANTIRFFS